MLAPPPLLRDHGARMVDYKLMDVGPAAGQNAALFHYVNHLIIHAY